MLSHLPTLSPETRPLFLMTELIYLTRLAVQEAPEVYLSPRPQYWDFIHMPLHLAFIWGLGNSGP